MSVVGLQHGQEVSCKRDLAAGGRLVARAGDTGVITGQRGDKLTVRLRRGRNINIHRSELQIEANWRKGQRIEAARNLYYDSRLEATISQHSELPEHEEQEGHPLITSGTLGVILGLANDTSKLKVLFETHSTPVNVTPNSDIEHAWRIGARRFLEEEERHTRQQLMQQWHTGWDRRTKKLTRLTGHDTVILQKQISCLTDNLLDEGTAPQSFTGWTPIPEKELTMAQNVLRTSSNSLIGRFLSRIEKDILDQSGEAAHYLFYGLRLYVGLGVDKDIETAKIWFEKSTSMGDSRALNMLGVLSAKQGEVQEAKKIFTKAVEKGNTTAAYNLGCLSSTRSRKKKYWEYAVSHGHLSATYRLGKLLLETSTGKGSVCILEIIHQISQETPPEEEINEHGEEARMATRLQIHRYYTERGFASPYKLIQETNDSNPTEETKNTIEEAVRLLYQAHQQGHAKAQYLLGIKLLETDCLEQALVFLKLSATQGVVAAQHQYGVLVFCGTEETITDEEISETESVASSSCSRSVLGTGKPDTTKKEVWPTWQGLLSDTLRQYTGSTETQKLEGFIWIQEAAMNGCAEAQNSLALCLLHGEGSSQKIKTGMTWLNHAANQKSPAAIHNLACCLFTGEGHAVDTRKALSLWREAVLLGCFESQQKLVGMGNWVFQGDNVTTQLLEERNTRAECELVLKIVAEKGPADSARLATTHGDNNLPSDTATQNSDEELVQSIAALEVDPATPRKSVTFKDNGSSPTSPTAHSSIKSPVSPAIKIPSNGMKDMGTEIRASSHLERPPFSGGLQGEVAGGAVGQILEAQYTLGLQFLFGIGVDEDLQAAAQWFWRVADSSIISHNGAQNVLGVCFEHGLGVPRHVKMAVHWYRRAAQKGMAVAMHNLATCLFIGDGVRENKREACRWWMKAAEQNHHPSVFRVALCELCGEGCMHNKDQGLFHLREASEAGISQASLLLNALEASLNPDSDNAAALELNREGAASLGIHRQQALQALNSGPDQKSAFDDVLERTLTSPPG